VRQLYLGDCSFFRALHQPRRKNPRFQSNLERLPWAESQSAQSLDAPLCLASLCRDQIAVTGQTRTTRSVGTQCSPGFHQILWQLLAVRRCCATSSFSVFSPFPAIIPAKKIKACFWPIWRVVNVASFQSAACQNAFVNRCCATKPSPARNLPGQS